MTEIDYFWGVKEQRGKNKSYLFSFMSVATEYTYIFYSTSAD